MCVGVKTKGIRRLDQKKNNKKNRKKTGKYFNPACPAVVAQC